MKKLSILIISLFLTLLCSSVVYATSTSNEEGDDSSSVEIFTTEYPDDPSREPSIVAEAAIIMDAKTGQILYEKNIYDAYYPASITKVLTMLVALENCNNFSETVTFSDNAIWGIERDSSHIALDVGEQISVEDCLYAISVVSANEAAYGLAEHIGGDLTGFTDMMNKKVEDLGGVNSHFANANGLHDPDHYTCAYDMALITKDALRYKMFRELTSGKSYIIPSTNKKEDTRELYSKNKILKSSSEYYYEFAEGSKTGYTTDSLNTLVTYAKKDDLELICVILRCHKSYNAYTDTRALFKYCYNNYKVSYPLSDFTFDTLNDSSNDYITKNFNNTIEHDTLSYTVDKSYSILIPSSADVSQITKQVEIFDKPDDAGYAGKITLVYGEQLLGEVPVLYDNLSTSLNPYADKEELLTETSSKKTIFIIIGIILVVILLILLIIKITLHSQRRRRRRSRRRNDYYF